MSDFVLSDDAALISFQGKKGLGRHVLIDRADFENLSKYKWFLSETAPGRFYARACTTETYIDKSGNKQKKGIYMHRLLMSCPPHPLVVDHVNGNGLDNRRSNLRVTTVTGNNANRRASSSKNLPRGVRLRPNGKFYVLIKSHYKTLYLGTFDDEDTAARVYDQKAFELHGELAILNFPHGQ